MERAKACMERAKACMEGKKNYLPTFLYASVSLLTCFSAHPKINLHLGVWLPSNTLYIFVELEVRQLIELHGDSTYVCIYGSNATGMQTLFRGHGMFPCACSRAKEQICTTRTMESPAVR